MLCAYYTPIKCVHLGFVPLRFDIINYLVPRWHVCSSSFNLLNCFISHLMVLECVRFSCYGFPPTCTCIFYEGTVCSKFS